MELTIRSSKRLTFVAWWNMNKELIELRIKDLLAKGKELETQLHQINGALQQCEWTLNELKEQDNASDQGNK